MYSASAPLVALTTAASRRRAKRADIAADTLMADREGRLSGLRLLNLSAEGILGLVDVELREREPIRIDLPAIGWVAAEIVWVLGGKVGAAFRTVLAPHQMRTVLDEVTR